MSGYIVTFIDGPAEGVQLDLARNPYYLRVVRGIDGKWDALDQLDDDPALGDEIFIYRRGETMGHVLMTPRKESCWLVDYEATDEIDPEGMEDPEAWKAAATAAGERRREEEASAREPA